MTDVIGDYQESLNVMSIKQILDWVYEDEAQ